MSVQTVKLYICDGCGVQEPVNPPEAWRTFNFPLTGEKHLCAVCGPDIAHYTRLDYNESMTSLDKRRGD